MSPISHSRNSNVGIGNHLYSLRIPKTVALYTGRKPVSASSATCAQNARHSNNQAIAKLRGPPESRPEFMRCIVPQTIRRESLFTWVRLLGLRRGIQGRFGCSFGLGDGRKRFHVEFLIVPIARHDAGLDPFHQQEAHADVRLHVSRQPYLVVHKGLLENEAGALLQIRQQAAGNFHVACKIRFQPGYVVRLFVHPNDSGEFLRKFFHQFVRLEFGIGLEIEHQHVLSAESFPARIHELARAQEYFDSRLVFFVALPLFLCLLFFRFFLGLALLVFLDALFRLLVFFFLFIRAQWLSVLFHQRGDFLTVEIEKRVLVGLALLHPTVAFEFSLFLGLRSSVVLF